MTANRAVWPFQHLLVSACGAPIILSALTGHVFNVITQVGGGDEVWHNPGDNRFFVTAADSVTGVQALGVIDAETNTWLQNVSDVRGRNPSAFPENNHIFNAVTAPVPPTVEDPKSPCVQFGLVGRGCIAVFGHDEEEDWSFAAQPWNSPKKRSWRINYYVLALRRLAWLHVGA